MWERHAMTLRHFNAAKLRVAGRKRETLRFPLFSPMNTTRAPSDACGRKHDGATAATTLKQGAGIGWRPACASECNSRYFLPWVDPVLQICLRFYCGAQDTRHAKHAHTMCAENVRACAMCCLDFALQCFTFLRTHQLWHAENDMY